MPTSSHEDQPVYPFARKSLPHTARSLHALSAFASFLLAAALVPIGIIVYNTARVHSRQVPFGAADTSPVNTAHMVATLAAAIRVRTVGGGSDAASESDIFSPLITLLDDSFPRVRASLIRQTVTGASLLYTWAGKDSTLPPIILAAHMDVVDASPAGWSVDPFSGAVVDNAVWGRGALDDKSDVVAIFEAVESLLGSGFEPRRTVYLAFGHDEEEGGVAGAAQMSKILSARPRAAVLLDEGSNVFRALLPGIAKPIAAVGIAEKGYLDLEIAAWGTPGHASMPVAENAILRLNSALEKIANQPPIFSFSLPVRQMLESAAAEMHVPLRAVLANLWLTHSLIIREFAASPASAALLQTTVAPTLYSAGEKSNTLPQRARAVLNVRLLPGDTSSAVIARLAAVVNDPSIQFRPLASREAPPVSDLNSAPGEALQIAIRRAFPDTVVLPILSPATTDSGHYTGMASQIFRFSPYVLNKEDLEEIHGRNEHIAIASCTAAIRFYRQFIKTEQ